VAGAEVGEMARAGEVAIPPVEAAGVARGGILHRMHVQRDPGGEIELPAKQGRHLAEC